MRAGQYGFPLLGYSSNSRSDTQHQGNMSKYQPLAGHLSNLKEDQVRMTFGEIERLAKLTLPKTAYKHQAWWANSRTRDSHGWAHLWLQAGWESCNLNLERKTIEFRRAGSSAGGEATIASLYPTKLEHLMDLLVAAGTDVTAWAYRSDGSLVEKPKANPDYCYDWSFGTEEEGFVLCLWCDLMDESGGAITYNENVQDLARDLERAARNPKLPSEKKSRVIQQARRARAFDDALDFSYRKGRPLRVILNAGDIRSREEITEKASRVALRRLDPLAWYVHRYARDTGGCVVIRGRAPDTEVTPAEDMPSDGSPGVDDARRLAQVKIRRGQAEFRQTLLAAYSRRCAVTGSAINDLLEAAHIVPHSEETNYRMSNGLLLRADIHTLYDVYLLSVDERMRVHVSKTLKGSEYWVLHGQILKVLPDSMRDLPASVSLSSRHARFVAAENKRV
jgi:hypothetical protein